MDETVAKAFAAEWIAAWNTHDVDRVLAHYADDFEMSSPLIVTIAGEPSGRLKGKAAIGAYWRKALALHENLQFTLVTILVGADSIVLHYRGSKLRHAAEIFHFGADGKVIRAAAHYDA